MLDERGAQLAFKAAGLSTDASVQPELNQFFATNSKFDFKSNATFKAIEFEKFGQLRTQTFVALPFLFFFLAISTVILVHQSY